MALPFMPPELWEMIWKTALEVEASTRIVPVDYDAHVIPRKQLVSPLLSICRESRWHALRFYSIKLPIYKFPKIYRDADHYSSLYGNPARLRLKSCEYVEIQSAVRTGLDGIRTQGQAAGFVYLSPQHDTFLCGIEFTKYFLYNLPWTPEPNTPRTTAYVSALMRDVDRRLVQNMVLAETLPQLQMPGTTAYALSYANLVWGKLWFPSTKGWRHCWLPHRYDTRRERERSWASRRCDGEEFFGYMGSTDGIEKLQVIEWGREYNRWNQCEVIRCR
ncbi:uncharacterized protein PG986_004244 [Apiospora aurea]|uniref:2EXR domain-containing protein n=1 Tax=Apiospora aurea TaxID=335848 RepID=A0ABR1QM19_9PEZI